MEYGHNRDLKFHRDMGHPDKVALRNGGQVRDKRKLLKITLILYSDHVSRGKGFRTLFQTVRKETYWLAVQY